MVKIAYCAGHGINTPGKRTPDDEREWTFNNIVASAFAEELSKYEGATLKRFDDATGKTDVSLNTRTSNANKWGADYYISFHHNANTGKWGNWGGVETFVYTNPQKKSLDLAITVHSSVVKGYGLRDRGIKRGNLHIVRETKMPAILIEGGFMDSTTDIATLRDKEKLQNAGRLIAQALANHLGLKTKQAPKAETKSSGGNTLDKNKVATIASDTMRKEAIKEIKAAVADGRFTSKHENVEKYSDTDLQNFMLVALARR